MTPYADFSYFGLLLYPFVITLVLGCFGRANWRWLLLCTAAMLAIQYSRLVPTWGGAPVREIALLGGFAIYQGLLAVAYLRWRAKLPLWLIIIAGTLPLAVSKFLPVLATHSHLSFAGISYISFRALEVLFSIHDKVVTQLSPSQYFGFLLFFPTISSGPIDRYRRFAQDWAKIRSRREFLDDLDAAIQYVARGFLYKFIIAALIRRYWMDPIPAGSSFLPLVNYMYAYTAYLFFDFAGYSAFAIGLSRLFGIRTPENFDKPFLARNIRDFWNRWHISLSFWFRDHVYMRFLLAAGKRKWFKGKHTASYLGLFLTFGLMGVWHMSHRLEWYYFVYGLYHAALLCGFDAFTRWNRQHKRWGDTTPWRIAGILLTFHAIAFGLLVFSGRLDPS